MKTIENQIKEMSRKERRALLIDKCHCDLRYLVWSMMQNDTEYQIMDVINKLKLELNILKNLEQMRHPDVNSTIIEWSVSYHLRN